MDTHSIRKYTYEQLVLRNELIHSQQLNGSNYSKSSLFRDLAIQGSGANKCNGLVTYTSGSTGVPKLSLFDSDEWRLSHALLASKYASQGVLSPGDRICNLANTGRPSFLAVHDVINNLPFECCEIPLGPDIEYLQIFEICMSQSATTLASASATILALAIFIVSQNSKCDSVTHILCGGENLTFAQRDIIRSAFPGAKLVPFIYGGADFGMLGYSDVSEPYNTYRLMSEFMEMRIISSSSSEEIVEPGVSGQCYVSNYLRGQIPVVNFPTGDIVQWIDAPGERNPRFKLIDRSEALSFRVDEMCMSERMGREIEKEVSEQLPILLCKFIVDKTPGGSSLRIKTLLSPNCVIGNDCLSSAFNRILLRVCPSFVCESDSHGSRVEIEVVDQSYFYIESRTKFRKVLYI